MKIEILPINKAPWVKPVEGLEWAYRITPRNPDNAVIGVMSGTRKDVQLKAETIRDKLESGQDYGNPFGKPIKSKFNRTGL